MDGLELKRCQFCGANRTDYNGGDVVAGWNSRTNDGHKCGECEEPFDARSFRDVLGERIKELLDGGMAGTRKRVDMVCE